MQTGLAGLPEATPPESTAPLVVEASGAVPAGFNCLFRPVRGTGPSMWSSALRLPSCVASDQWLATSRLHLGHL